MFAQIRRRYSMDDNENGARSTLAIVFVVCLRQPMHYRDALNTGYKKSTNITALSEAVSYTFSLKDTDIDNDKSA